jgi:predicted HicB family RNase H-like nuclease
MNQMGRPREYDEDRVTKAIRIDRDLDASLKAAARERDVSVNVLVNAALRDYLKNLVPLEELLRTAS